MSEPTAAFRYQPIKGNFEPYYCGIVVNEDNRVLEAWWECPHCGLDFRTRAACQKHCKGEDGQFLPSCPETKNNGKCCRGCKHE